jgi:hypothetical protein
MFALLLPLIYVMYSLYIPMFLQSAKTSLLRFARNDGQSWE